MAIHPTAVVGKHCEIDPSADIGASAVIEDGVCIGENTRIFPHAYISTGTTIGRGCSIHPFAVVGHWPQDLAWKGEPSFTQIGDETIIREHASIHRGTMPGSTTRVGSRCFIMSTAHVGHNCVVGDDVKLANGALLAGHVHVGDKAFISGHAMGHQFVRIGSLVMASGGARLSKDVPPFLIVAPVGPVSINVIGLRRAGLSQQERLELHRCYRLLYREGLHFPKAIELVAQIAESPAGRQLVEFLRAPSKRGYLPLHRSALQDDEEPVE
ncbi:MAG: acyl-ACP--UDP-N-acetylglucosamine O-acyltransferase [Phycisphaerae bacterium]